MRSKGGVGAACAAGLGGPAQCLVASVAVKAAVKGSFRFPLMAGSPASVPNPINCWPPSGWIQPKTSSTVWSAYWKSRFHLGWSSEQFLVWGTPQGCNWTQESIGLLLAFLLSSQSHILKFIFLKSQGKGPARLTRPLVPEPPTRQLQERRLRRISGEN